MVPELISPEFLALQDALKGRYSLVRELGRGGMGVVFLAREVALDRLVALKLLPPALSDDAVVRERFLREARTAASLAHPNIVPIHAVEASDNLVWFAMEYVPGETLGGRIRRLGKLPAGELLPILQETAYALAHAHARGVIHRDVKPDNILLDEESGRVVVTDFGIAHAGGAGDSAAGHGTLHYMAPEQALGEAIDARADVYGLGVTAFHAVTGRRPFEGLHGGALLVAQREHSPPPVTDLAPGLMPPLAAAIDRAIARDPANRFLDADAMAQSLQSARALVPQVPAPLRGFARHAVEHGRRLGPILGLSGAALIGALFTDAFLNTFFDIEVAFYGLIGVLAALVGVGQMVSHLGEIRSLAAKGHGRDAALRVLQRIDAEEEGTGEPIGGPAWSRKPRAVIALGTSSTVLGLYLSTSGSGLLSTLGFLMALVVPVMTVARVVRLKGARGSWWTRVLRSWVGRWCWRVATLGMAEVRPAPVAGEPTALAIGSIVHGLWAQLPEVERKLLEEVPDLADRLEARALERGSPDAAEAITALETLRIDLLRLRAGQLPVDGLTEDLAKLQDVGRYVDARGEA
jgi:serine/threonine-protein kinase